MPLVSRLSGWRDRAAPAWQRGAARTLAAIFVACSATAIGLALKFVLLRLIDANGGFIIYVPAIAAAAWYGRLAGGLLATLLLGLGDSLLFDQPFFLAMTSVDPDVQVRLVAYAGGGMLVSFLIDSLRRARERADLEAATSRRALELGAASREQLARMLAAERRANEMRDAFNSIISHELRTPITAIYGGAKLLAKRERSLDAETRHELIADVEAEADRLYRLVEDLLVLARTERGVIESPDAPLILQHVLERSVASEQSRWPTHAFSLDISGDVPTARGDDTYVEQVMRNLLSNAAKYSPADSHVQVTVDTTSDAVRVRVLDEGAGITRDEARQLFELYYRSPAAQRMAGGAGIGLFVCRALVEAMGGRMWAAPRPAGGSEFGFLLQRYELEERSQA
jgi:K+-sensing histidine kinase KdpD